MVSETVREEFIVMGQITIYPETDLGVRMRAAAKEMNMSLNIRIANLIEEKTAGVWPESVIQLAGAWPDFPTSEEIRTEMGNDVPREIF